MFNMKLTCIIPVWKRPQRTIRAIESVMAQDFEGYEALFIGDKCPIFQQNLDYGTFDKYEFSTENIKKGNSLVFKNLETHTGGWGTAPRHYGISVAKGEYVIFLDNDDVILPNHFSNYYNFIKNKPHLDWAYFNARTEPWKKDRISYHTRGSIGNAELIIKTNIAREYHKIDPFYEHDWRLVERMLKDKCQFEKCKAKPTYIIMGCPGYREKDID